MANTPKIPPLPNPDATEVEFTEYFETYDLAELKAAGYVTEVLPGNPDYPQCRDQHVPLLQLNLIFTPEDLDKIQPYMKKVHGSLKTLAKQ